MLLNNGLMLMLSLASVSGQIIDCAAPSNDSSSGGIQASGGVQQNADSPFDCPLFGSPSSSTTQEANNSTQSAANNSTLFQLLNSTNSPVPKFMTLITSSPEFKPLIDILSNPGNHTIFLPCDEALGALESLKNETNGNQTSSNGTSSSSSSSAGSTASLIQQNKPVSAIVTGFKLRNGLAADGNQTENGGGNQTAIKTDNMTEIISQGLGNFSLVDILNYHVINGSWPIKNISHGIHVNDTLMSNKTAYPLAIYAPLVIINNSTASNQSSSDNSTASTSNGTNSANGTTTSTTSHITFLASNATNATTHNNSTTNFTVGNGIGFAKVIVADITASNGILHIIDKVLVPPVSTVNAIEQLNETQVNAFLNKSSETSSLLDSANNITIFLPSDEALQNYTKMNSGSKMDTSSGENTNSSSVDMDQLIKNHIVNGTYYTTNFTTSPLNVTTLNGTHLQLKGNGNGTLFKVGNATIVKPDILTNRAVVMVIDEVLQLNQTGSSSPSSSPSSSATSEGTESATSTTSTALRLTSSSSPLAHILGTSLISLLFWSIV